MRDELSHHVTNIDVMDLFEFFFYLIYIFINIIMLKTDSKIRGKLLPLKGISIIRSFLHLRTNFHGFQCGQRDLLNAMTYCPQH